MEMRGTVAEWNVVARIRAVLAGAWDMVSEVECYLVTDRHCVGRGRHGAGQIVAATAGKAIQGLAGQPGATGTQDRYTVFLNGPVDRRTVAPDCVALPASLYILQAGAVIPTALITGNRSDILGQITAQVTENVYDSPTGNLLLIPQGMRIIGQYDAGVAFGQCRMLLVWNRPLLPNGRFIMLECRPGADTSGYAGLEGGIDYP